METTSSRNLRGMNTDEGETSAANQIVDEETTAARRRWMEAETKNAPPPPQPKDDDWWKRTLGADKKAVKQDESTGDTPWYDVRTPLDESLGVTDENKSANDRLTADEETDKTTAARRRWMEAETKNAPPPPQPKDDDWWKRTLGADKTAVEQDENKSANDRLVADEETTAARRRWMEAETKNAPPPPQPKDDDWWKRTLGADKKAVKQDESTGDTPWYDVRTPLMLEAKEAKHFVIGAGRNLQAVAGSDQLHLLVGGAMLLAVGVVVGFARRSRNRKAAEKALADETYFLMA